MIQDGNGRKKGSRQIYNGEDEKTNPNQQSERNKREFTFPVIWIPNYNMQEGERTKGQEIDSSRMHDKALEDAEHRHASDIGAELKLKEKTIEVVEMPCEKKDGEQWDGSESHVTRSRYSFVDNGGEAATPSMVGPLLICELIFLASFLQSFLDPTKNWENSIDGSGGSKRVDQELQWLIYLITFSLFLQIRELSALNQSGEKFNDEGITTIEQALKVERTDCGNCLVWAKSDSLARDVIKLSSDITVGYIVMRDPSTGARTNLLRIKDAEEKKAEYMPGQLMMKNPCKGCYSLSK
ncbi:hypothetical protein K1719_023921 [Acacia pycnantha]|nr:hypothetical protein K1719_023921 [Acacia pycnantha]